MKFNSNSITVKVDSRSAYSLSSNAIVYSPYKTEQRAEALTALLVSANPLRKKYVIREEDYEYIADRREEINQILEDMERYLSALTTKVTA